MTDTGVDFHLDVERQAGRLAISAYVAADTPRSLAWRLVAVSRTSGGTSEVVQSGTTDGRRSGPVGAIAVSPQSQGCVVLTISENGREIGRQARSVGPDGDAARTDDCA